ncbi:MAG: dockerin type 1, partial [Clostridiaceae bacterium]
MKKKIITMLIVLILSAGLAGCKSASTISADSTSGTSNTAIANAQVLSSINVSSGESESVGEADTFIELGSTITVKGSGATVD